jgi:hypothetical protein
MRRLAIFAGFLLFSAAPADAVPLRQVIRDCGADGKAYCEGVGYGAPMQACLSRNKKKLTPACRAIIDRLDRGEQVEIFG